MTSSTAAITDEQVNSDAYLIPSMTDLLDDHLGVGYMPTTAAVQPDKRLPVQPGEAGLDENEPGAEPDSQAWTGDIGRGWNRAAGLVVGRPSLDPPKAIPAAEAQPAEPVARTPGPDTTGDIASGGTARRPGPDTSAGDNASAGTARRPGAPGGRAFSAGRARRPGPGAGRCTGAAEQRSG